MGIPSHFLRNRHGACPCCGGCDRFRYDNKDQRGSFFCGGCGPGDGFTLLMRYHSWDHRRVREELIRVIGLGGELAPRRRTEGDHRIDSVTSVAQPTKRVFRLRYTTQRLNANPDVVEYLTGRALWPGAARTSLRAHAGVDYFDDGRLVGRYPAMLAAVRDLDDKLVTIHVTYIEAGRKLTSHQPRKLMSQMRGREGCAVRLTPILGDVLGVAEGIETAISAASLYGIPTWAVINTAMMGKFTPPRSVRRLVIFADADDPGQKAASCLTNRLSGRLQLELRTPPVGFKDWNDVLMAKGHT